jgi:hypothetical protein
MSSAEFLLLEVVTAPEHALEELQDEPSGAEGNDSQELSVSTAKMIIMHKATGAGNR